MPPRFGIAFRGYDQAQVDELLDYIDHALASADEAARSSVCQLLRSAVFPARMRGYARAEVEQAIEQLRREFC